MRNVLSRLFGSIAAAPNRWAAVWLLSCSTLAIAADVTSEVPAAPAGLVAKSGGNSEVPLAWSASPGATAYRIFASTTQNDTNARPLATSVEGTTYTAIGLKNDTTYYFRVKALNDRGESPFSNEVSAVTATTAPLRAGLYTLAPVSAPRLRLQIDATGAAIGVAPETMTAAQQWRLESVEGSTYRLSPAEHRDRRLSVTPGDQPAGVVAAKVADATGATWLLSVTPSGYRLSPAGASGLALAAAADGRRVALAPSQKDVAAQLWLALPVDETRGGAADPGTAYVPSGYRLVFRDEFDGRTVNTQTWETLAPYSQRHLNDEIECYEAEAVRVQDGLCILTAEERATVCGGKHTWRSGAITSRATYTRGYFEARIKVPQGKGLWPAFWLTSSKRWPPEWDIMEIPYQTGTLFQYMHPTKQAQLTWVGGAAGSDSIYSFAEGAPNPYSGFVIYGCEVTDRHVKLWINGRQTAEWKVSADTTDPMWVSVNLAVGGSWPGLPDETTPRGAELLLDYVRIYQ